MGEALALATASRDVVRFDTMHAVLWDRGRFVALYAEPARGGWTIQARTIACPP